MKRRTECSLAIALGILSMAPAQAQLLRDLGRMLEDEAKNVAREVIEENAPIEASCLMLAVEGGATGSCLENQLNADIKKTFRRMLRGEDLALHETAVLRAIETGENVSWKGGEGRARGEARVVSTETERAASSIPYSTRTVQLVPGLDLVGAVFSATRNSNVRSGPSTDYEVVGSIARGEKVDVLGKVENADFYLIGVNGVGNGYVYGGNLERTEEQVVARDGAAIPQQEISIATTPTNRECREIEQVVVSKKGKEKTETIRACKGPNGWEVQS